MDNSTSDGEASQVPQVRPLDVGKNSIPAACDIEHAQKPVSLEGAEKLKRFQDQLLQKHGGKPLESSVDLLRQAREERERELASSRKPVTREGIENLMQIRDRILQEHGGQPFENSVGSLRQEREEREQELDF